MKTLAIALGIVLMNTSAQALDGKWPTSEKQCPQSQDHFAVVVEHVSGTNNSLYCKLITGESYKYLNNPSTKLADYIDCSKDMVKINSLVLITKGYHEMWDKLGNKRCMNTTALTKVIGKVSY